MEMGARAAREGVGRHRRRLCRASQPASQPASRGRASWYREATRGVSLGGGSEEP